MPNHIVIGIGKVNFNGEGTDFSLQFVHTMKNFLCNDNIIMRAFIGDEANLVGGNYIIHMLLKPIDNDLGKDL